MTITSIDAQLVDAQSKKATLSAELKTINDRAEAEADRSKKAALLERSGNLIAGIAKVDDQLDALTKGRSDAILAGFAAGHIHGESGDGASPMPSFGFLKAGVKQPRTSFAEAVMSSGFDVKANRLSVELDGTEATKAQTLPSVTDWNRSAPGLVPLGQDRRWLFPNLPSQPARNTASIQDFVQTARTVTGTVERALNATTDKADLATTTTLVNTALSQFAVTISDIPNAVLESVPALINWLDAEGEFQVYKAIDAHVMAKIVAASPASGLTGANLVLQFRNAISAMRAVGANPTLAVVNPTDSVEIDTYEAGDGAMLFGTQQANAASPLWGLNIVERIGAGTENPFLIDPSMLGVLYMGNIRLDADPYTGFKKNLTTLRVEVNALMHVRNAQGAYEIVAD